MRSYLFNVGISFSILVNAVTGGNPYQTFCARNYEARRRGDRNLVWLLDSILGADHCMMDWIDWQTRVFAIYEEMNKKKG